MKLFKEFSFEAAHKLPLVDKNHKCFNLHGHSFKVKVTIEGPVNALGWVMDFSDIKKFCQPIIEELDHKYLNEIDGWELKNDKTLTKSFTFKGYWKTLGFVNSLGWQAQKLCHHQFLL